MSGLIREGLEMVVVVEMEIRREGGERGVEEVQEEIGDETTGVEVAAMVAVEVIDPGEEGSEDINLYGSYPH